MMIQFSDNQRDNIFLFQSDLETIKLETIKGRNHEQIYIYNLKPINRQSNWKRWRKKLEMLKPRLSFSLHADFCEYDIFDHLKIDQKSHVVL